MDEQSRDTANKLGILLSVIALLLSLYATAPPNPTTVGSRPQQRR